MEKVEVRPGSWKEFRSDTASIRLTYQVDENYSVICRLAGINPVRINIDWFRKIGDVGLEVFRAYTTFNKPDVSLSIPKVKGDSMYHATHILTSQTRSWLPGKSNKVGVNWVCCMPPLFLINKREKEGTNLQNGQLNCVSKGTMIFGFGAAFLFDFLFAISVDPTKRGSKRRSNGVYNALITNDGYTAKIPLIRRNKKLDTWHLSLFRETTTERGGNNSPLQKGNVKQRTRVNDVFSLIRWEDTACNWNRSLLTYQ